jgi:hypothetical protein
MLGGQREERQIIGQGRSRRACRGHSISQAVRRQDSMGR